MTEVACGWIFEMWRDSLRKAMEADPSSLRSLGMTRFFVYLNCLVGAPRAKTPGLSGGAPYLLPRGVLRACGDARFAGRGSSLRSDAIGSKGELRCNAIRKNLPLCWETPNGAPFAAIFVRSKKCSSKSLRHGGRRGAPSALDAWVAWMLVKGGGRAAALRGRQRRDCGEHGLFGWASTKPPTRLKCAEWGTLRGDLCARQEVWIEERSFVAALLWMTANGGWCRSRRGGRAGWSKTRHCSFWREERYARLDALGREGAAAGFFA